MKIRIFKTNKEASIHLADHIKRKINENNKVVLGLATGSSPEDTYKQLIEWNKEGQLSFKEVTTFNLDEYVGLQESNSLSYHTYMNEKLFDKIDIDKNNTFVPNGNGDVEKNASDYEELINSKGGIDVQILGIGINGHIAFNEPGSSFDGKTSRVKLTQSTIDANSRFFSSKDEVPKEAISMGIGSILKAKKIYLIALGENKAKAIKELVTGEITESLPASAIRKHNNVTIIMDEAAGNLIKDIELDQSIDIKKYL